MTFRIARLAIDLAAGGVLFLGSTTRGNPPPTTSSPAAIAVLASHPHDQKAIVRFKAALADPNPDVRGVAARAITTGGVTDLLADVETALKTESDPEAAREEIRALVLLGSERTDPLVFETASRFDGALDRTIVRAIARARGIAALPLYFQKLESLRIGDGDRAAFFRLATRGEDSLLGAASMALGRQDLDAWKAVLADARHDPALAGSAIVRTALGSDAPVFQSEAAWYLAKEYCDDPAPDRDKLLEILETSKPETMPDDPEIGFGRELLRRVLGGPAVESKEWIACLRTNPYCHLDSDLELSPLRRYLTEGERQAIDARNAKNTPPDANPLALEGPKAREESALHKDWKPRMWLMTGIPHGLADDFMKSNRCGDVGLAEIGYRPDGRPGKVTVLLGRWPMKGACFEEFQSLYLLSLAPPSEPTVVDRPWITEVSLDPAIFSCAQKTSAQITSADPTPVRGRVEAPKLQSRLEPVYPNDARAAHEQGITIIEAVIRATGCVSDVRLLRSSTLSLDASAMKAISGWRYRPATLDGNPVAVYLTVTVNFRLGTSRRN